MTTRTNWKAKYTELLAAHVVLSDGFDALETRFNKLLVKQIPAAPSSLLTLDAKRALMRAAREEAVRTGRCVKVTA